MNRGLRQLHRRMWLVLLIVIPLVYVAGLAARRTPITMERIPDRLIDTYKVSAQPLAESTFAIGETEFSARLFAREGSSLPAVVELERLGATPLAHPDVLVYWTPTTSGQGQSMLADAYFMGVLTEEQPQQYALPEESTQRDGRLLFYSLGHKQMLDGEWRIPYPQDVTSQ